MLMKNPVAPPPPSFFFLFWWKLNYNSQSCYRLYQRAVQRWEWASSGNNRRYVGSDAGLAAAVGSAISIGPVTQILEQSANYFPFFIFFGGVAIIRSLDVGRHVWIGWVPANVQQMLLSTLTKHGEITRTLPINPLLFSWHAELSQELNQTADIYINPVLQAPPSLPQQKSSEHVDLYHREDVTLL